MKKLFTISEIKNSKVVFVGKNKLTNEIEKLFVKKIDELFNVFCLIDDEVIYECQFESFQTFNNWFNETFIQIK